MSLTDLPAHALSAAIREREVRLAARRAAESGATGVVPAVGAVGAGIPAPAIGATAPLPGQPSGGTGDPR